MLHLAERPGVKRLLAMLLALCLLAGLLPAGALAAETGDAPQGGEPAAYDMTMSQQEDYRFPDNGEALTVTITNNGTKTVESFQIDLVYDDSEYKNGFALSSDQDSDNSYETKLYFRDLEPGAFVSFTITPADPKKLDQNIYAAQIILKADTTEEVARFAIEYWVKTKIAVTVETTEGGKHKTDGESLGDAVDRLKADKPGVIPDMNAVTVTDGAFTRDDWLELNTLLMGTLSKITAFAIDGKVDVAEMGTCDFGQGAYLETIRIPQAIAIPDDMCSGLVNLKTVDMPNATRIGENAFGGCTALTEANFGAAVSVGDKAFHGCTALTRANLPAAAAIGKTAFSGCTSLSTVQLGDVTSLGQWVFEDCALSSFENDTVTSVGESAFAGCGALKSVALPNVETVGESAFNGCAGLERVTLPKATELGISAFKGCASLTEAGFPKVETVGMTAFAECAALTSVSLPVLKKINYQAFYRLKIQTLSLPGWAVPVIVDDTGGEKNYLEVSTPGRLVLLDKNGAELTGGALADACILYDNTGKQLPNDKTWNGWALPEMETAALTGLRLDPAEANIAVDEFAKLTVYPVPGNAVLPDDLTWSASFDAADIELSVSADKKTAIPQTRDQICSGTVTVTGGGFSATARVSVGASAVDYTLSAPLSQEEVDSAFGKGAAVYTAPDRVRIQAGAAAGRPITIANGVTVTIDVGNGGFRTGDVTGMDEFPCLFRVDKGADVTFTGAGELRGRPGVRVTGSSPEGYDADGGVCLEVVGSVTLDGVAVYGGNGGGINGKPGNGGPAARLVDGGTLTMKGASAVQGGAGGYGEGNESGGAGASAVEGTGTVTGPASAKAVGGNGGSVGGTGNPGTGGKAVSGSSVTVQPAEKGQPGVTLTDGKEGMRAPAKVDNTNAGGAKVEVSPQELADAVLTDEERAADDIKQVDVTLAVEKKEPLAETVSAVETAKPAGMEVGLYLDITLEKQITKTNDSKGEATPVTDTQAPLTISVTLPAELRGDREYSIIRVHDGTAEALDTTYDSTTGVISAQTDKFSVYAVAYKEKGAPTPPTPTPPPTPSPSDDTGADSDPTYRADVDVSEGGSASVTPTRAARGDRVTITPAPDAGYMVDRVTVTGPNGKTITVQSRSDGSWSFTQPDGKVTVTVTFKAESKSEPFTFTDVAKSDWFYESVKYVYENGLMMGTSATAFAPNLLTDRGMIVTILWRLEGAPAATAAAPFADVDVGAYYADAVAWAAENGIVKGYSSGGYGPNDPVTREQLAVILYGYARFKGLETPTEGMAIGNYADGAQVSPWARDAMRWALAEGFVSGKDGGRLDPKGCATRAEAAAMLMRFLER